MKIVKQSILLICILFLTGCTTVCDLEINNDETFDLSISVKEMNMEVEASVSEYDPDYYEKIAQIPIELLKNYKTKYPELELSYSKDESHYYGKALKEYKSFDELKKSTFLNSIFESTSFVTQGDIRTISLNKLDSKIIKEVADIDNTIEVNISLPYTVQLNNASNVNKLTNTYTWILSGDLDSILLEYNVTSNYNQQTEPKEEKSSIVMVALGILGGLVVLGVVIAIKSKHQK